MCNKPVKALTCYLYILAGRTRGSHQGLFGTGKKLPPYPIDLTDRGKEGAVITKGEAGDTKGRPPGLFQLCGKLFSRERAGPGWCEPKISGLFHGDWFFTGRVQGPRERKKSFRSDLRHDTGRHRLTQSGTSLPEDLPGAGRKIDR
ncbi:MAG: hypothetical protein WAK75_04830 [Methanoregula sp.]